MKQEEPLFLLIAEDDPDDRILIAKAFKDSAIENRIQFVEDGEELMDFLSGRNKFKNNPYQEPALILLDLNMPKKDGREALREIKANPNLKHIPVIVLTTSGSGEDVLYSYRLGVNSYITKPIKFPAFIEAVKVIGQYWLNLVQLPSTVK
jgi:two-component system, response regulator